jgi:hypothetical protein
MNIENFKSYLAGAVAAKTGIWQSAAEVIAQHVVNLPSQDVEKKLNLPDLGEVVLINQKRIDLKDLGGLEPPYEAVVNFDVDEKPKKLVFRDLEKAKRGPFEKYRFIEAGEFLLGSLEGDPRVPVRRRRKNT